MEPALFFPYAAIALVVIAAFARSLASLPIWDDEYLTVRNENLASWSGVRLLVTTDIWSSSALHERSGYYRPIASLSYALNRLVFGNSVASYHAGNVILHVAVASLLYAFVVGRKIARPPLALACALLFATMPLVAEPVSWLAGRYDLVGAAFAMLALELNRRNVRAWAAPIAFAFAIFCKEPYALVAVLIGLDDLLLQRRRVRGELVKYGALVVVAVGYSLLRRAVGVPAPTSLLEQGGPMELVRAYAFAWKTLGGLALWPNDLSFFHTYVPASGALVAGVVVTLAAAFAGALVALRRTSGSTEARAIAFGLCLCAGMMVPGALTGPTLRIIGDRYAYFPLVGAMIALAGGIEMLRERAAIVRFAPLVLVALAGVQVVRLESRLAELRSPDAFFGSTLARDPDNFTTLTLWGSVLARRGEYARAEALLVHAREVAPFTGDVDAALSFVHLREGRNREAEEDGRRAVASKPSNPRGWVNLASALVNQKKSAEAIDVASEALRVRPHYAEAHVVRGMAYVQLGDFARARDDLEAALAIDPSHAQARSLLEKIRDR